MWKEQIYQLYEIEVKLFVKADEDEVENGENKGELKMKRAKLPRTYQVTMSSFQHGSF